MQIVRQSVKLIVAAFVLLGWELGAIEAISFSILVGVSIDYFIHFTEGYRHAGDATEVDAATPAAEQRSVRVHHAMTTVAIPIVSSGITTGGAAALLCGCKIQPLKRFGEILVLNVLISLMLTLGVTSSLLLVGGPTSMAVSWRQFAASLLLVAVLTGVVVGIMAAVSVQDSIE